MSSTICPHCGRRFSCTSNRRKHERRGSCRRPTHLVLENAAGWSPGQTTGDPVIDCAIARFIFDPRTLPCDYRDLDAMRWQTGGLDGIPEPPLPEPWADFGRKGDRGQAEQALTLDDIRRARSA